MEECIGECIGQVIFRGILTRCVLIIDQHIVQRRDLVVRMGRKTQEILHLPEWLSAFSDLAPGMMDNDIRVAAMLLGSSLTIAVPMLILALPTKGTFWDPWVMGFGVLNPICTFTVVWLILVLKKRAWSSRPEYAELDKEQNGREGQGKSDDGLEQAIRVLWMFP